ncbi:MAG: hypothetical protein ACR2QM_17270 [Longimicrobiales bacterium]
MPLHLVGAVFLGILGAVWSSPTASAQLAVSVLALGCLLVSVGWLRALSDEARKDLTAILLVAVAIRLAAFVAIRQSVGPYVFAPDAWSYEIVGSEIVQAWEGSRDLPLKVVGTLQVGYYYLNAVLQRLFGPAPGAPAVLNVFFGAWTTIPVYFLALSVVRGNRGTARWAASLVAVFPSLVLWSALNIREAPTILLLVSAISLLTRLQVRFSLPVLLGALACVGGIMVSRSYVALLVGISVPVGFLMSRGKSWVGSLVGGLVLLCGLVAGLGLNGFGADLGAEPTLQAVEAMRRGLSLGAETAYGAGFDVSTVGGAAEFLPVGATYFLFAPFPWELGSRLQSIAVPEMLIWYSLVPFILRGLVLGLRNDARSFMVLLAVIVTMSVAYALVQGNVGTAFRHRAQLLPLTFIFAAIGLKDWHGARVQRRSRTGLNRLRASGHLTFPSAGSSSGPGAPGTAAP